MKTKSNKSVTVSRKQLIALFAKGGYETDELATWSVKELKEAAEDAGLLKSKATASQKKSSAKKAAVGFLKFAQGASLRTVTTALAEGTTKLGSYKHVKGVQCHARDDMNVAPDLNIAWQAQSGFETFNQIVQEVSAAVLRVKANGIPKNATEIDLKAVTKTGGGFEGPYYRSGNFIFREHFGNSALTCAFPVSVLNKYFGAKL